MIKLKTLLLEALSADVQSAHAISSDFINYIKMAENPNKVGFKNGKWYPIQDPSAGIIIGYGHQLTDSELQLAKKGMDDSTILKFLHNDIKKAQDVVRSVHSKWVDSIIKQREKTSGNFKLNKNDPLFKLDNDQLEMLTDFVYNLGSLNSFPKFTNAVFKKDWNTAKLEYKRKFKDRSGNVKELTSRNKAFFDRFLSNK
jgi:GH24 family phage-related lysozyme (muramidase)